MAHIRELPPLRLHLDVESPAGRHSRWADDEHKAENIPGGLRFSDTMPGGFETLDVTLPRKTAVGYSDLTPLSTIRALGAGGEVAWEGRLERAPRVSGDQVAISPSAVGWQAHLEDDKSARMIYRDIDLSRWRPMSTTRHAALLASNIPDQGFEQQQDATSGIPALVTQVRAPWDATFFPISEAWYDAGAGIGIAQITASWTRSTTINSADGNWNWSVFISTIDGGATGDSSINLISAGPNSVTLYATDTDRQFAALQLFYGAGPVTTDGAAFAIYWTRIAVYGVHGLTLRGTEPDAGFYDADIIGHALGTWCPLLNTSLTAGTFIIPQAVFQDPTTAGEIIRQANRFGLRDWAVWDNKTFWLHDRGARGRSWRARVGPAQLEDTGPQVDRLWNSVIVAYQDVDGSTRTVGPAGSGADTEDAALSDNDPENPANVLDIIRREMLTMGTSTAAGAIEVGRRFLEESKVLNTSGSARIVGHVEDDRGVIHPYWKVRAGDTISFIDASDTSYRRIVRTDKSVADRTCSIDLDSPPEGLQALLERLGVVLVPLGL